MSFVANDIFCLRETAGPTRQDLGLLAFAHIPRPPPEPWQEVFALLRRGVDRFAASSAGRADPAVAAAASGLTLEWYTGVLARLHVNCFRCALPVLSAWCSQCRVRG